MDQGRMVSKTQGAISERRPGVLQRSVLSRGAAAFAIAVVSMTALFGLAPALRPVPGGGLARSARFTLATFAAVGLAIHRQARELHAGAVQYRAILDTAPQSFIAADSHGASSSGTARRSATSGGLGRR